MAKTITAKSNPNYEVRVGLFTIGALILIVWGWGWLKSASLFHQSQNFVVTFHDVAGLNKAATVNINGVRVGVVDDIHLVNRGQVNVNVRITADNVVVPQGSHFTIQTIGLVGAKYLEISLPNEQPGQPAEPAIAQDAVVAGDDPVRVELIVNDIATRLSNLITPATSGPNGSRLSRALAKSGEALENLQQLSIKLNNNMDKVYTVEDSVHATSEKFGHAADKVNAIADNANTFFHQGTVLTQDLQGTSKRMNAILDNPNFSSDLKETVRLARETASSISASMHDFNTMLGDKQNRDDIKGLLTQLNQSTQDIYKSLQVVNKLANDQGLRSDIKEAVLNAKDAMAKADNLMGEPGFKSNITNTLNRVRAAATNVEVASKQLSSVLGKRAPLLHMMFGKPGAIQTPEESQAKDENAVTK